MHDLGVPGDVAARQSYFDYGAFEFWERCCLNIMLVSGGRALHGLGSVAWMRLSRVDPLGGICFLASDGVVVVHTGFSYTIMEHEIRATSRDRRCRLLSL